jgi:hypothetical protein
LIVLFHKVKFYVTWLLTISHIVSCCAEVDYSYKRFEILIVADIRNVVFWNVMSCSLVDGYQCFLLLGSVFL